MLSDNNYKFDFALDIAEYLTAPPAFEIDFSTTAWDNGNKIVTAVIYGELDKDVEIYLETGGKEVAITVPSEVQIMTYDSATHVFKFDIQAVKTMYADQIQAGTFDGFSAVAVIAGEETQLAVAVQIMPETPQELIKMLGGLLDRIPYAPEQGGNIPDNIQP